MTKKEFFNLCLEAGFHDGESEGKWFSENPDDCAVLIEEYPIGTRLLKLAKLLGITIEE